MKKRPASVSGLCLLAAACFAAACFAGDPLPEDRGAAALWQDLLRLRTTATVMQITAHPDDEDGPLLTLLARGEGARTILLSLTRGEGGANLISGDFFDALGVLRTLEMAEVDRYYRAEQFYTRAVDYGFSKSIEEALRNWGGEEKILADVVGVLRRERPDVVAARFRGDPRDGHGHHQFAGRMAQRAIAAAADPSRFPEQIAGGLAPWQVLKFYSPASRAEAAAPETAAIDAGAYRPLLGRSYRQIAGAGYALHRSQGMGGFPPEAGPSLRYYRLQATADPAYRPAGETSLLAGLDASIAGLVRLAGPAPPGWLPAALKEIEDAVEEAWRTFDARELEKTVSPLAAGLRSVRRLLARLTAEPIPGAGGADLRARLRRKESDLQRAIEHALSVSFEASLLGTAAEGRTSSGISAPASPIVNPGKSWPVVLRLVVRSSIEAVPEALELSLPAGWKAEQEAADLAPPVRNGAATARFRMSIPEDARPSRPHWRRSSVLETLYSIETPELQALPLPPPPAMAIARLRVLGEEIRIAVPVQAACQDPRFGPVKTPILVAPPISVQFASAAGILPSGKGAYRTSVRVRSAGKEKLEGMVELSLPEGWQARPASIPFVLDLEGEEAAVEFSLSAPERLREEGVELRAAAVVNGRRYGEGFDIIGARDLGIFTRYIDAVHTVRPVDLQMPSDLRIGYVAGSGDDVPRAMENLHARPEMLGAEDLAASDLGRFDAILIGIRAYAVRGDLAARNPRLLDYVRDGGVVIVQYQTPEFDRNFGPFPYTLGGNPEETSEEDAPVAILEPGHPIFTAPNRITAKDFEGWVEQRGSKFWKSWDARYTPLLETHDRGQEPQRGVLLLARHGKGAYIYCALAWYRQLPFAVPGAYRIFANLISFKRTLASR